MPELLPERLEQLIDKNMRGSRYNHGMTAEQAHARAAYEEGMRQTAFLLQRIYHHQNPKPKETPSGGPEQRDPKRWAPAGATPR